MPTNGMRPVHPGEVLREDFLKPMGLSANRLGCCLGVPSNRIHSIVSERRSVTADTALRLATFFATTPGFWLGLQIEFDLRTAQIENGPALDKIRPASEVLSL